MSLPGTAPPNLFYKRKVSRELIAAGLNSTSSALFFVELSLHCYALGEVAWLVYVAAEMDGHVVGQ